MSKYNNGNMSNDTPDIVNMHHANNISHSMPHLHPHNVAQLQDKCSQHPARNTPTMQQPPMGTPVLMKTRHNLQNLELSPSSRNMVLNTSKYIKLNVGGSLYYSTIGTLTKEDNMLRAMFSGRMEVLTDNEGWILIDRCGKHFGTILNYLRNGSIVLPENKYEIAELLAEAKYYLIQGLINQCEVALMRKSAEADPICRVPVLTSLREEQELVKKTNKPIVKFMYNRSNNKYSYTQSSDDNLLKNIELFDKLSLQFNGRIMFMKDTIGDEICVWSFYGQHRKVAEICCTSIVYATEKKQTKVEFPEARIYEETLNILLFEPDKYDAHGMRLHFDHDDRTKNKSGVVVHHCQSDDDDEVRGHRVRRIHVANSNRPT